MQQKLLAAAILLSLAGANQHAIAQSDPVAHTKLTNASPASHSQSPWRNTDPRLLPTTRFGELVRADDRHSLELLLPRQETESHRVRNAAIGSILGAALGIGVCTGISNIMDDSARARISTCTVSGNLIFGVGGAGVGALIGAAIK